MKIVLDILEERISAAMAAVTGRADCAAIVRPATDAKFGDYQANGVMALAKQLKTNPRKLAEQVVENLDITDICELPEIAGPGFINLRLKPDFIAKRLLDINKDTAGLGIEKTVTSKNIVVDFSCPNIAKQMHVGHLRSTIIGDCICRTLEFLGHNVIRQNHVGDWGTQFGMLLQHLFEQASFAKEDTGNKLTIDEAVESIQISDLEDFYRAAKEQFDIDETFRSHARKRVVELHNHSNDLTIHSWQHIVDESRRNYQPIYDTLGVNLNKEHERGESAYNDDLPDVVRELKNSGLAVESDGAICVFPEGFRNKEGEPLPFIIQKSDGAYLYATTDLAAIRYRINELKADLIIYV